MVTTEIVRAVPPEARRFTDAVVQSTALSVLLMMDFVPTSRPPSTRELVATELPRILTDRNVMVPAVQRRLGGYAIDLERAMPWSFDPAQGIREYIDRVLAVPGGEDVLNAAADAISTHGHKDFVFGVMKYAKKQPSATDPKIARITNDVAAAMDVPAPDERSVKTSYINAHSEIIPVRR